jgi:hypothetical protein
MGGHLHDRRDWHFWFRRPEVKIQADRAVGGLMFDKGRGNPPFG